MKVNDLEIIRGNTKYKVSDNEITDTALEVVSFNVDGIKRETQFNSIDRLAGRFKTGYNEMYRSARAVIRYNVKSLSNAVYLKNKVARLFDGEFYVRELKATQTKIPFQKFGDPIHEFDVSYISGKQLKLSMINEINYDTNQTFGDFELEFETIDIPYYESIGTSIDLQNNNQNNLWSTDMNIDLTDTKSRKCTFENVSNGHIFYFGDTAHNQFNMECEITMVLGSSTKALTWHTSNSKQIRIEDVSMKEGDVVKYDGIQVFLNNIPINEKWNLERPVFNFGYNEFVFSQTLKKIEFKLKYYYE